MKNHIRIAIVTAAMLLAGAGCFSKPAAPAVAPEPAAEKPSAPGLPRMTEQPIEEDDGLEAALKDLETVE